VVVGAWRLADGYCFLSPRLRDEFIGILPKKRLWTVIPNGIASDWLDAETAASCERQQDIVFLGRWSAQKGVDDLVATMDSLDIGRTAECDVYSDYLFKFEPNGCRFHPWLDERGVKAVLRNAKVLLLPSHAEGFPNVLVQAAACGTPFVATRLAGVMDIVEESGAGLLCEVGDIGQLQTAVRTLLADASTWSDCSRNGRHWAESLSIARVAKLWHRYYAELGIDMSRYETHCDGENRPTCTCSKRMTGVAPL
jgi:glycosyltransferase involved in cell wall biosynthesis